MTLDERVKQFRVASRELFNSYFRVPTPYNNNDGWLLEERFSEVQSVLFRTLVLEPASLPTTRYGDVQRDVIVGLENSASAPIMLNRDINSGYWDYPVKEVTNEARMLFICFFDWDQLAVRDNSFVRVYIDYWPSHSDVVGKHALIESQYVSFQQA